MNPYLKKYKNGGKGDPEDPIKDILNIGLKLPKNEPMPGLGGQPYQQTPTYSYNWNTSKASTPTAVHIPSGTYITPEQKEIMRKAELAKIVKTEQEKEKIRQNEYGPGLQIAQVPTDNTYTGINPNMSTMGNVPNMTSEEGFKRNKMMEEYRKEAFWDAVAAGDKAIGQYLVQPTAELFNTPFATVAEGVNAIQGKEYDFGKVLPNPTRMALNAEGMGDMVPQQQFLSDYLGVDRKENPYLALGLDIFTPGPAMVTKPLQALTGIGKASKGTIQYASKMNALDRAIDSPLTFIKEEVSPFVSGVNPNLGFKFADQTIDATKALQQADQNVFNAARQPQVAASTTQAVAKEYTPWTQQEMPGLHIKSTMSGSPFEKQLSKTGELNVSNIQAHINRADVSQQDKATLQKVLNNRFAGKQKVDYNEFRKAVQEEAVELRRVPVEEYQHKLWGVQEIGYPGLKQSTYETAIKTIEDDAKYYTKIRNLDLKNQKRNTFYEAGSDVGKKRIEFPGRFRPVEDVPEAKAEGYLMSLKQDADEFFKNTYPKKLEYESALKTMPKVEIMTFENAEKFGTGNAKHFKKSTLGHTRTMVDPEQPGIWHTLEQQSDYFQDTKRYIPNEKAYTRWDEKLPRREQTIQEDLDLLEYMKKNKKTKAGDPVENYQIDQFEEMLLKRQEEFNLQKGDFANPQQKEFFGNAHQERLLQENVKLAAENGMNKVRYPTAETAVKIQKYQKVRSTDIIREYNKDLELVENPEAFYKKYNVIRNDYSGDIADQSVIKTLQEYKDNPEKFLNKRKAALDKHYKALSFSGMDDYSRFSDEHETVLRKYKDNQKMIEKTLGVKVSTVTDAKGNTWYEFDIPDAYKQGKAEIKAFNIGGVIGTGAASASIMQQSKEKFRTGGAVNPYLSYNNGGKIVTVGGKKMSTDSEEYRNLYNNREIASYSTDPNIAFEYVMPEMEIKDSDVYGRTYDKELSVSENKKRDDAKKKIKGFMQGDINQPGGLQRGAEVMTFPIKGAKAAVNLLSETANTPLALLGEVISGRNNFPSAFPSLSRSMENAGITGFGGDQNAVQQMTPGNAIFPNNQYAAMAVDLPADILLGGGVNALYKQGAKQLPKITKALGIPPKFKSEIDWSKWNKEIPSNKDLMKEYTAIEKSSKSSGTWMKNADGSEYQGMPEQFVQENSSNFKKAFPEGFDKTYRGSQFLTPRFDRTAFQDKDIITFGTSDESVAKRYATNHPVNLNDKYQDIGEDVLYWHPDIDVEKQYRGWSSDAKAGMYEILYPKGQKTINAEGQGNRWFNIKQDDVFEGIKQNDYKNFRGEDYRKYFDPSSPIYWGNEMTYGNVATDDMAAYMIKNDIPVGKVSNVYDGRDYFGNPKPANVTMLNTSILPVKSRWYNNGMFDMTNPNIFKGLIPIVTATGTAAAGASQLNQEAPQNRYGGQNPYMTTKYKYGGPVDPVDPEDKEAAMRGMMKARMAIDAELGRNPAAKRMTSISPKEYTFTGNEMFYDEKQNIPAGATGTHYTTGEGNVMFPIIQEGQDGNLFFNRYASPTDKEAMRFETPEEASYFGENYKNVAPMMYNKQEYGKGGNTKSSEEEINCTKCGWSWKLSEGGDKPYMCHECNHDNSKEYNTTTKNQQEYSKGGDAGHSTVEIERSERVYTPDGKLIMETPADAPTHEEGGVKVTLPAGSLVFPKKYYKALDAASGLPAFKKITNTMLNNAEKAYLRGEAYSSGGKRK